jgi:hypothetical protein
MNSQLMSAVPIVLSASASIGRPGQCATPLCRNSASRATDGLCCVSPNNWCHHRYGCRETRCARRLRFGRRRLSARHLRRWKRSKQKTSELSDDAVSIGANRRSRPRSGTWLWLRISPHVRRGQHVACCGQSKCDCSPRRPEVVESMTVKPSL